MNILFTFISLFLFVSTPTNNDIVGKWLYETPDGKLTVEMKADLSYEVDLGANGSIEITGTYAAKDGQITVKDTSGDCVGLKGVYSYVVSGSKLTMTKVSDECEQRGGGPGSTMTMIKQ